MIKALVIDDSAFMRKAIEIMLNSDEEIQVVGTARDGMEGYEKAKSLNPDIITLDIEMPRTNGLECLDLIMKNCPTSVLVVSSVSTKGAEITMKALEAGAADFIPKSQSFVAMDITNIKTDLLDKIKQIVRNAKKFRFRKHFTLPNGKKSHSEFTRERIGTKTQNIYPLGNKNIRCIMIGVSTGGPPIVQAILTALPSNFPVPILIAQHMPENFTKIFANRLNSLSQIEVVEAEGGMPLRKGVAYIAKGGKHLIVSKGDSKVIVKLTLHPADHLYHPSVDILFSSIVDIYGASALGIILTGMGKDGLEGSRKLKSKGGLVFAQNEESCVVYGMPKAVVDAGVTEGSHSVQDIIGTLKTLN